MRSRRRYPVALLLVLAAIALSAAFVSSAAALPTFTQAQFGIGPCATCHTQSGTHGISFHAGFNCTTTCHLSGSTGTPPTPAACGACHGGVTSILTAGTHVTQGCGSTNGCHGFAAAPTVTSFAPTSGPVGTVVTLTGTQFTGATTLLVGGVTATTFTVNTPKSMKVTVPAGAVTGTISVTTTGGTIVSSASFTVTTTTVAPKITKLSPTAGKRGSTVTISGSKFGAPRGTSFVKFGSTKATKYVSWSASKIKVRVPSKAKFAKLKVTVTVSAHVSNAKTFTVKR